MILYVCFFCVRLSQNWTKLFLEVSKLVGIYKRKQENTLSTKKATKKKEKRYFFFSYFLFFFYKFSPLLCDLTLEEEYKVISFLLIVFLVGFVVEFLFSFINSHLRSYESTSVNLLLMTVLPLPRTVLKVTP